VDGKYIENVGCVCVYARDVDGRAGGEEFLLSTGEGKVMVLDFSFYYTFLFSTFKEREFCYDVDMDVWLLKYAYVFLLLINCIGCLCEMVDCCCIDGVVDPGYPVQAHLRDLARFAVDSTFFEVTCIFYDHLTTLITLYE
jgi:hypothetical protein